MSKDAKESEFQIRLLVNQAKYSNKSDEEIDIITINGEFGPAVLLYYIRMSIIKHNLILELNKGFKYNDAITEVANSILKNLVEMCATLEGREEIVREYINGTWESKNENILIAMKHDLLANAIDIVEGEVNPHRNKPKPKPKPIPEPEPVKQEYDQEVSVPLTFGGILALFCVVIIAYMAFNT